MRLLLFVILLKFSLLQTCCAFPIHVSDPPKNESSKFTLHRLSKRSFDKIDNNGIFSFGAARYNSMDEYDRLHVIPDHIIERDPPVYRVGWHTFNDVGKVLTTVVFPYFLSMEFYYTFVGS